MASRVIQHFLVVPLLILSCSHVSTGQNLEEQDPLEGSKVVAALEGVSHGLECLGNMFKETLHFQKQSSDAITALGKLPEMMFELKADMEVLKKTVVEDRLKVEAFIKENKDLKSQQTNEYKTLEQLQEDLKTAKEDNEKVVLKVQQLERSHEAMTKLNEKYVVKVSQLERDLDTKSKENEQQIKKVEEAEKNLQTLKGDNKQEVLQLKREIEDLKRELEDKSHEVIQLNRKVDATRTFAEQLNLKNLLKQYNSTKDWSSLRSGLETVLDHSSAASLLLQNITNNEGSPVWKIGYRDYTQLAMVLLSAGLGVNIADKDGDTMLHGAVQGGHIQLAEVLLDYGADTEARGWKNSTPITRLEKETQLEVLKLLVEHDANVNSVRSDGTSSLHWAAFYGDLDAVKYLVDEGANTAVRDVNGMTPLDRAQKRGYSAVVEFLLELPH